MGPLRVHLICWIQGRFHRFIVLTNPCLDCPASFVQSPNWGLYVGSKTNPSAYCKFREHKNLLFEKLVRFLLNVHYMCIGRKYRLVRQGLLTLFFAWLITPLSANAQDSTKVVQFSGYVVTPDSLVGIPFVNIRVKERIEGLIPMQMVTFLLLRQQAIRSCFLVLALRMIGTLFQVR